MILFPPPLHAFYVHLPLPCTLAHFTLCPYSCLDPMSVCETLPLAPQLLAGAFSKSKGDTGLFGSLDGAAYEAWVYSDRSLAPPVLLGGWAEHFTRTTPAMVAATWLPVIALCCLAPATFSLPALLSGLFVWGLYEYTYVCLLFCCTALHCTALHCTA